MIIQKLFRAKKKKTHLTSMAEIKDNTLFVDDPRPGKDVVLVKGLAD